MEVVYTEGLNWEFSTSIEFLAIKVDFWEINVVKLSTKNPDLNLYNPFASLIVKLAVSFYNKDRVV